MIKDPSYLSFHVLRGEFDEILLDNAARHGAELHEATRVEKVDLDGHEGGVEVVASSPGGGERRLRARFLIDASGRDTFLASRMKAKKPHANLDRAALSTHWAGRRTPAGSRRACSRSSTWAGTSRAGSWPSRSAPTG